VPRGTSLARMIPNTSQSNRGLWALVVHENPTEGDRRESTNQKRPGNSTRHDRGHNLPGSAASPVKCWEFSLPQWNSMLIQLRGARQAFYW
jgi:hypothetical protein